MLCCKTLIMPFANCTEGICLGPEREFLSALGPAIVSPAQDLFRPCEVSPSLTPITFIVIIIIHTYYPASLFIQVAHCAATPVVYSPFHFAPGRSCPLLAQSAIFVGRQARGGKVTLLCKFAFVNIPCSC